MPLPLPVVTPAATRSVVSLVRGEDRRKNVYESLMAIDRELAPALKRKKYVLIKPNLTSNVSNWRPRTPTRCAASWTTWGRGSRGR